MDQETNTASDTATKVVIPKETVTRLLKDIRQVMTDPTLDECGIIYQHSETDILTGYACIVGPSDSLYFGGYYYFVFKFPTNYPHSPPSAPTAAAASSSSPPLSPPSFSSASASVSVSASVSSSFVV